MPGESRITGLIWLWCIQNIKFNFKYLSQLFSCNFQWYLKGRPLVVMCYMLTTKPPDTFVVRCFEKSEWMDLWVRLFCLTYCSKGQEWTSELKFKLRIKKKCKIPKFTKCRKLWNEVKSRHTNFSTFQFWFKLVQRILRHLVWGGWSDKSPHCCVFSGFHSVTNDIVHHL